MPSTVSRITPSPGADQLDGGGIDTPGVGRIFRWVGIKKKVKAGRSERSIWGVRKSPLVGGVHESHSWVSSVYPNHIDFCDELQHPLYPRSSMSAFKALELSSVVLRTSALGLPQSIEIDQRPDKKFIQGFYWGPCCCRGAGARWATRASDRCPCLLTPGAERG